MLNRLEDYLDAIQQEAIQDGLNDFRLAREEFHNLTGKFQDGEPWFELRMNMFIDWYLLDRPGRDQLTPTERFLCQLAHRLSEAEQRQMAYLTTTLRSVFQVLDVGDRQLRLHDLAAGGHWHVHSALPTIGFRKDDILDTRIIFWQDRPTLGRGTVLHPREANETIGAIIAEAKQKGMPARELTDHLDKMRLKLDRYSNVRIQHVYRYPDHAVF